MSGIDLLLKYSYSPNLSGFCGPRNAAIIQDARLSGDGPSVTGIDDALQSFTGAVPYYELIARSNQIRDPFDARVIEAYWIGNDLLNNVEVATLFDHLRDRFKTRVGKKTLDLIAGQSVKGARPHHSFHVFDAFSKTGGFDRLGLSDLALNRIDECRIGWGDFKGYTDESKKQIIIEYEPIIKKELGLRREDRGKLIFGQLVQKILDNQIDGIVLFSDLQENDLLTFHWSRISDVITKVQATRLRAWTLYHLNLVNRNY